MSPHLERVKHCTFPFPLRRRLIHASALRLTDRSVGPDAGRPQRKPCRSARIPVKPRPKNAKANIGVNRRSLARPTPRRGGSPSSSAGMGGTTNLDLGDETAVWRDAIPAILDVVQSILPRDLEVLHDEHYHEGRRG